MFYCDIYIIFECFRLIILSFSIIFENKISLILIFSLYIYINRLIKIYTTTHDISQNIEK